MRRRLLFEVDSPLGYSVVLSRNRWREIVRFKHPALSDREDDVRKCIGDPIVVRASQKDEETHLYYAPSDHGYLCVVVGKSENGQHFVVTAYLTREVKKGGELWTK